MGHSAYFDERCLNEQASKAERHKEDELPGQNRDLTDGAEVAGRPVRGYRETLHELAAELGETCYQLGWAESRLELMVQAESTLREALQCEHERADRAECRAGELEASSPPLWRHQNPKDGGGGLW